MLKIVGIGASAGGLEAFTGLLGSLPTGGNVAYVLVQHLDPTHRSLLSELLGRTTTIPVHEIQNGSRVEANRIYVIPPNCDLDIRKGVLELSPRKNAGAARSIDHFLLSLAADQKENAIGVILSGAGSDGAKGLKAIKTAGGITFAQDASAKYDSMPRSAIGTGCVDFVLPPAKIAEEIARLLNQPHTTRGRAAANARNRRGLVPKKGRNGFRSGGNEAGWPAAPEDLNLRKIFVLLRGKTGIDFGLYRPSTVGRRLNRRLAMHKLKGLDDYVRLLRERPGEVEALHQDLLLNVTSFFRNSNVFEMLKKKVFPKLVREHQNGDALRMWVAGTSTGQEAYSIAMAYAEFCEHCDVHVPVQIFATDVNPAVLELARAGLYTKAQIAGVSPARLQRFFQPAHDAYRVQKAIRDMVIFAQQNLMTDPPFTRVDLISCRNLLIYLEPALQQRIIPSFHYGLKPNGFLLLGSSESVGPHTEFFEPVEKSCKIYIKKPAANWLRFDRVPTVPITKAAPVSAPVTRVGEVNAVDVFKEADRLTLEKHAPPGVLVNESGEILQFRGDAKRYLDLPTGKANFNLFKMVRGGLSLPLQKALQRARKENRPVREKALRFDGSRTRIDIEVLPLKNVKATSFLVHFEKTRAPQKVGPAEEASGGHAGQHKTGKEDSRLLSATKRELAEMQQHVERLQEDYDTSVEELQASNEEVQSANEELQSLNEELETSNEELESANEELTTLNEELATRNSELRASEQRLREQAELLEMAPVLARSPKDRIIFWNRGAEKLYGFTKEEAVGQTAHLLLGAQFPAPLEEIQALLQRDGHWEGEVWHRRKDGRMICIASQWVLHYDAQKKPRAVLEVNSDITARKQAENALRESQEFSHRVLECSPDCVMVLDLGGRLSFISPGGKEMMAVCDFHKIVHTYWPSLWEGEERTKAENAYRAALRGETSRFHASCRAMDGKSKWWDVVIRPMLEVDGRPEKLLSVARDITDQKLAEIAAAEEARLSALRAGIAVEVSKSGETNLILQRITEHLVEHVDAALARIWTLRDSSDLLDLQASAGIYAHPSDAAPQIKVGDFLIGRIAAEKEPRISPDLATDPKTNDPDWLKREGMVTFAGYPLAYQNRVFGVIAVYFKRSIAARVLKELCLSADVIAQFLERSRIEDERAVLYREAMEARNEAIAATRAKDDFLAALSHELRTPLNPVLLLASEGADDPGLSEEVRGIFKTIRSNVTMEARLIDDLLDVTRIAHGKMALEMKPTDIHAVLRDAIGIVSAEIEAKRIRLSLSLHAESTLVMGDGIRLQQVFWNVLKNAVKFTPAEGQIWVDTIIEAEADRMTIRISDSGIGLARDNLDSIFDAFSQTVPRQGGLGLGLAITRRLVRNLGGSIRAMSKGIGKGATFEIQMPLAPQGVDGFTHVPDGDEPPAVDEPIELSCVRRILLIEDHIPTRTTLEKLLLRRNFEVISAGSIAEARECAREEELDVVISDLGLPDGDGCKLFEELRAARPALIGLALSGYGMDDDIARSRKAGFSDHLTKPVDIKALTRAITTIASKRPSTLK